MSTIQAFVNFLLFSAIISLIYLLNHNINRTQELEEALRILKMDVSLLYQGDDAPFITEIS
jgi:hypothetical protein